MTGIYQHSPIKVASLESIDKRFRGRDVGCHGDVVKIAKTKELVIYGARS